MLPGVARGVLRVGCTGCGMLRVVGWAAGYRVWHA